MEFKAAAGGWAWALVQWAGYRGPLIALLLTFLTLGGWTLHRSRREQGLRLRDLLRRMPKRLAIQACRVLAVTAAVPAIACLLISLDRTPAAIDAIERDYQHRMYRLRDPAAAWRDFDEAVAAAKADAAS